jgi:WD40 repeat protein
VQSSDFLIWNVDDAGGAPLTIATHGAYGAFSGDGTVLVTGGSSALRPGIEIWKLSGNELAAGVLLDADGDSTDGSGFLQDGRIFQATGDTMRIWRKGPDGGWRVDASVDQAKYVRFAHAGGAAIVAPSSTGALIMEEGVAGAWSTAAIATKKNPSWGAISPDGGTLLFDDGERKASVWTRQTQGFSREAIGGDKEPIEAAAVSLGGASIASLSPRIEPNGRSSARRRVSLWTRSNENAWTSQLISEHADFGAKSIAISRDGRRVAATGGDSIWVWTQDRRGVWSEEQIEFGADVVRISPDGSTLATAKPETGARIWKRREDGKWIDAEIGRMNESVDDIEFSPDGRSLLATGLSGGMRVLDVGWLGVGGDDGRYDGQRMTAEVCALKLPLSPDRNLRRITAQDISSAPVLRGREGEDVCSWRPSWYDDLLEALFGWTG